MLRNPMRVVVPSNIYSFLGLLQRIIKKHQEEGPSSPLSVLNMSCWDAIEEKRRKCFEIQQRAEALRREGEQLTAEKHKLQKELLGVVRAARNVLLGIHAHNPKNLGEWGFEVNHSPSRSAKKTTTPSGQTGAGA